MHRLDLSLYSHMNEFRGSGVRTHVNSKGNIPFTKKTKQKKTKQKISPEEDQTNDAAPSRTASPTHYQKTIPAPDSGTNWQILMVPTTMAGMQEFGWKVFKYCPTLGVLQGKKGSGGQSNVNMSGVHRFNRYSQGYTR